MNLNGMKRPYDTVISIGSWCGVTNQLKDFNLRRFSGPFDWVTTPTLTHVNRVLKNRFQGYMDINNMKFIEYAKFAIDENDQSNDVIIEKQTYVLEDVKYNIGSYHDFLVIPGQSWTVSYPEFREKLDRRINRFFDKIKKSQSTLFVRYCATYEEVVELQAILSELTEGTFHILIVNPVENLTTLRENNWGLDGVVFVDIPMISSITDQNHWRQDDWNYILSGITLAK
ncbi:DUF1796 family putative cysteine peptidase [Priestia megaterium]|uniref:DUF1796 family putative cysteine peptidase n=1 Tax=Priestia megaterium TaxID=1404 RepID=UPI0020411339|nr:DUF1796 family putative cysteine peptidase [Priestia megaterium]MCM3308575.1 papain-like cysteine peptidase [Priestia megaterium]